MAGLTIKGLLVASKKHALSLPEGSVRSLEGILTYRKE
jgi:hypothetical protein